MRSRHPLSAEQGQVLPAALLWIILLMALLAATHAVGQAVARRTALQLLADAGAYSGASAMSVGFNALTRINKAIRDDWWLAQRATTPGLPCSLSRSLVDLYDSRVAALTNTYLRLNVQWQSVPSEEARRVSRFNLYDLFPLEHGFSMGETDREMGLPALRDEEVLVRSVQYRERRVWPCTTADPPFVIIERHTFLRHFTKADGEVKTFAWVVTSPAAPPQIGSGLFTASVLPPMKAAAVAKPVGGEIEAGVAGYIVKLLPFSAVGITEIERREGESHARRIRH